MTLTFACIASAGLLSGAAFGQATFDAADVHVSPRGDWVKKPRITCKADSHPRAVMSCGAPPCSI